MPNVIVKGFTSDEHAKAFIDWFEHQGEQYQVVWFEDRDLQYQNTDCGKTFPIKQDNEGNFILQLQK